MPVPIEVAAERGAHVPYLLGHTDREAILMYKSKIAITFKTNYQIINTFNFSG